MRVNNGWPSSAHCSPRIQSRPWEAKVKHRHFELCTRAETGTWFRKHPSHQASCGIGQTYLLVAVRTHIALDTDTQNGESQISCFGPQDVVLSSYIPNSCHFGWDMSWMCNLGSRCRFAFGDPWLLKIWVWERIQGLCDKWCLDYVANLLPI